MNDKILSIQSKVVYGYVGNNIAELAIQLQGLDIITLPTVLLSAHTGHQPIHGKAIPKDLFDELVAGIEAINVIDRTSCVITGYIGTEEIIGSATSFIQRIKHQYTDKLYLCDPVMGDVRTGLYIPDEVAQKIITELIPLCDLLTPNHFELEYILGHKIDSINMLKNAMKINPLLNKKTLIITSCELEDTPKEQIETIVVKNGTIERIFAGKIAIDTVGTGDLFMAILAAQLTKGKTILVATTTASITISKILNYIVQRDLHEMNAASLLAHIHSL